MFKRIIEYLQSKFLSTDYFEKVWTLCVLKEGDGKKEPFHYIGKGNYESVRNFDHFKGSAYFRKNGDITIVKAEEEISRSCQDAVRITFPVKAIICIPRDKVKFDDEYAEDLTAQSIIKLLASKSTHIRNQIKAFKVSVLATRYSTDTLRILNEEISPVTTDINYNLIYMSIDLNIEVVIDKNCIEDECEFDSCYSYNYSYS